jgi:glucose-1-phosphate thymidylyltransferase
MRITSGIILAGGTGSRLAPLNKMFNKHLIPIYNRYIIDYPLDTLRFLGIQNLTVVLGGPHFSQIVSHIKDGRHLGMSVNYVYQENPLGIAHAIFLCERFVEHEHGFIVILGDNIFENIIRFKEHFAVIPQIILSKHPNLHKFGVVGLRGTNIVKIEEKPEILDTSLDNYAITGCYRFNRKFFDYFHKLQPSIRGEFEITDIINMYRYHHDLSYTFVDGMWSDVGTHESINYVNNFFYQKSQGCGI